MVRRALFTQNPLTAHGPAYGQRQPSHRLCWPYPGDFSRFRPAYLKLYQVSRIVGDGVLAACGKSDVGRFLCRNRILCEAAFKGIFDPHARTEKVRREATFHRKRATNTAGIRYVCRLRARASLRSVRAPDPFICAFRRISSLFSVRELNHRRSRFVSVVAQTEPTPPQQYVNQRVEISFGQYLDPSWAAFLPLILKNFFQVLTFKFQNFCEVCYVWHKNDVIPDTQKNVSSATCSWII